MIKSDNSFSKNTQKCHQIEEGEQNGNFVQNDTLFVDLDEVQVKTETIESLTEVKTVHVDQNGEEGWLRRVLDAFNWDDFFYALLMGLLPCVLDISTDFRFAIILDVNEKNSTAAGLAYAIIIMPGIDFASYFIFQKVWDNVGDSLWARGPVLFLFTAGIGLLLGGLLWSIVHSPAYLFYPAVVSAALLLAIKLMALVIHTPDMKRVSAMASSSEGNFEAAYQLLLMLLTWLTGGGVHILSIAASVLVIGKTRSERHLSLQPDLKMHEKTFERKVLLVAAHTPIFSLAAIFRIGSLALISGCLPAIPTSVDSFIKFQVTFFCFQVAVFSLMPLLIRGVSRWCPPLGQLTALEACQGVLGSISSVSVWPSLNHKTGQSIQRAEAVFFLVGIFSTATFVFKLNSKVACSICVAGAVLGGSGAEVVQISVGISLPLTILLICLLGLLSTGLIFFFL